MDISHIAIILDGNRRWAKKRGLPPQLGHKKGAEVLEKISKQADERGLKYLTVYVFSTENWKRTKTEVDYLMKLFVVYFKNIIKDKKSNIKINVLGSKSNLSDKLKNMIDEMEESTKNNTGLNLNLCFNYGGRVELIEGIKEIAEEVKQGKIDIDDIDEEMVSKHLYSKNIPDPDLIIRTSGEQRLSNFLMWQGSYSELLFIDKYWPDFTIEDLEQAVEEYNNRSRRFGK